MVSRSDVIDQILLQINGTLPGESCGDIMECASRLPDNAVVYDLNCYEGRSSIAAAYGLELAEASNALVLSFDTHVTDALSDTPYRDGTIMSFLNHLRNFKLIHRVVPVLSSPATIEQAFNKRAANLVIVQSYDYFDVSGAFDAAIQAAKYAIRKGGLIALCCPASIPRESFKTFVDSRFNDDFDIVLDKPRFILYRYGA
jgi:hypothetical protein